MLGSIVHLAVTQTTFSLQCRGCMGERMPSLFCWHSCVTDDVSSAQVMRAAAELATTQQQHLHVSSGLCRSSGYILHDACVCCDVQRDLCGAWLVFQAWTSSRRAASGESGRGSCTTLTTIFGRAPWRCRRTTSGAEVYGVCSWCPLLRRETWCSCWLMVKLWNRSWKSPAQLFGFARAGDHQWRATACKSLWAVSGMLRAAGGFHGEGQAWVYMQAGLPCDSLQLPRIACC